MERYGATVSRELYRALTAAMDAADDGVCVTDRQGGLLYQNAALGRLLIAEGERRTLDERIADVRHASVARAEARQVDSEAAAKVMEPARDAGRPSITVQLRTSASEYRLRGSTTHYVESGRAATMIVVWVRQCRPRYLTLEVLRERYGLTPREVRVASLVAAGSRSREIAEALGISPHTARRHAEAVLRKLGVHSRVEVRERLKA